MSNERLSLPVEGRRWAARTARVLSAAASLTALVLLKMWGEGLRLRGRALRRAAASGSLLESATLQDGALPKMMRMLFDGGALQQHRGMQSLSTTWAICLCMVKVLRRTMRRLFDYSALQQHRGMQALSSPWATCLSTEKVLRRIQQRPFDYTALQQHKEMQVPLQRCSDWARDALAVT